MPVITYAGPVSLLVKQYQMILAFWLMYYNSVRQLLSLETYFICLFQNFVGAKLNSTLFPFKFKIHNLYCLHVIWSRRQCLNELQKEYFLKTKIIALDWIWVTLWSWCQMNRNGHSFPVKHHVGGKHQENLEK